MTTPPAVPGDAGQDLTPEEFWAQVYADAHAAITARVERDTKTLAHERDTCSPATWGETGTP